MITLTDEQALQIEEALVATLKNNDYWLEKCTGALDTIRAARAQEQSEQEPVAWTNYNGAVNNRLKGAPVSAKREWVDLTDDEVEDLATDWFAEEWAVDKAKGLIDDFLAKFKERNTPPVVPQGEPVAWGLAEKVRRDLDRQSCPDAYMRIAMESIVKHYPAPVQPVKQEPVCECRRKTEAVIESERLL